MTTTAKPARDAFTLSLGGLTSVSLFAFVPAIEDDRIRVDRPARPEAAQTHRDEMFLQGWDYWPAKPDLDRAA